MRNITSNDATGFVGVAFAMMMLTFWSPLLAIGFITGLGLTGDVGTLLFGSILGLSLAIAISIRLARGLSARIAASAIIAGAVVALVVFGLMLYTLATSLVPIE